MSNNIFIYSDNVSINTIDDYSIVILDENDISIENIKNANIVIFDKENEKLIKIIQKINPIVFTNISKFKYINSYIYYENNIQLHKYLNALKHNSNKLFTICIPIFNSYEYLDNCIGSIFNQSYKNYLIYICDDFSNAKKYEKSKLKYKNFNNIFFFRNDKNMGKFLTLNTILDKIYTNYFLVLDSDDMLEKNRLVYDLIYLNDNTKNNIMCAQSKYIRYNEKKKKIN